MDDINNRVASALFWTGTHTEIKRRLLDENSKAREVGDMINGINCPNCGKPDSFAHANEPNVVMCHRNNQCGVNTLTRDMFPDLFTDFGERFKPTIENPYVTAEAFLQARGLETTSFKFSQSQVTEGDKNYPTVKIEFNGVSFQRLIDYKGSNKTRLTAYKGKHYATSSVEGAEQDYIVEGIIDALVLEQSGIPAIATLSSGHNPEACFKQGVSYVLAFDNDKAGHKAIRKFKAYLNEQEIKFSVALPPKGKDWNDLLICGELSDDKKANTLELCKWRGALAMATDAVDYFKIYCKKYSYSPTLFEFKNQTYKGAFKLDDNDVPTEYKVNRLLDCVLNIAYSIEDASLQYESRISHIVNVDSTREGINTIRFKGADFSAPNDFKAKLLQYRLLFFGAGHDLTLLAEYLFKKKPIKVRECQALGYDPVSDCYVFTKFLYDKDGKHYTIDKDGYFHQHRLKPFSGQAKSITKIGKIEVGRFITDLYNAYGDKGLLALGFWVSTSFSHIIFDEFGFFPFMSFHGDPHCGKSDLTTMLNRCFYRDAAALTRDSIFKTEELYREAENAHR